MQTTPLPNAACPGPGRTEQCTIGSAIARWASAAGDSPAIVAAGAPDITFSQLHSSIACVAGQLANAGLKREDRVGLLVPAGVSGAQLVVALGCNVTLVPINPALTPAELLEFCKVSSLRAVVIPRWLETRALPDLLERTLVLQAVLAPDGAIGLELLTPAIGPATPLRPARETDVALILRSSGTTGAPKLIPVTHANLVAMAGKMGSDLWFHIQAEDRAACILPLYYAAGLKTSLFVPLILGASVAFPPAGQAYDIAEWAGVLKPTYLSLAPGALNGMLDRLRAPAREFDGGSLRFVMCAAAYLPEDVRLAAQSMLRVPVLEFYGLSEAGVMAANPVGGRIKPGTVGLPAPGEVVLVDDNRRAVASGAVGQIMIAGPTVTPGYVATDGSGPVGVQGGWLATGDLGRIDADGYLTIVGRAKEVINRGGEKVFPYEIEKAMLRHAAVLEAAAYGVPHPRLGESVAAAVVLKPGSVVSAQELRDFVAARLAGYKLPRSLRILPTLPRGSTGKVLRGSLASEHAAWRRELVEPDGLLEFELRDLWGRLLGTDDLGIDDDFFEKGGDSLLAAEMLLEIELLTGKPYPQSELSTLTIRRMADVVTSGLKDEREPITQVRSGSGVPLFFCHGDFATRGLYAHKLAALLPEGQPVFLLHCPDQLIGSSMEEIASAHLAEVLRIAPDSPVFLGGYCNGGLAAWHLAHLLRARGVEVVELLLVETLSLNARPGLRSLPPLLEAAASVVPRRAGRFLREHAMRAAWIFSRKGPAGVCALLYREAARKMFPTGREQAGQAPRRDAERRVARVYYQLMSRYAPPRIDVDVTCLIAEEGNHFDTASAYWRSLAPGLREVRTPGTHQTALVSERQALAKALADALKFATIRYREAGGLGAQPVPDRAVDAEGFRLLA
jgi:acyl-CoA synthetase (AMP-forming)/AMP-acid ligase II/thioesterase domain-containing protein